ncbi:MAG: hypothetical protein CYPHOPRED_000084 [Cyphobasidiales sp. Tagirdzhanova-0007]|nr:MAG: hypothetical protein CYPHOPRED_000084 [Cyphobasidiales sp. Tagirdzhanova-0007]
MESDNDATLGSEPSSPGTASGTSTPSRGSRGGARFDVTPLTAYHEASSFPSPAGDEDEGAWSEDADSPPAATTPTWEESYSTLRRTLSYKTFQELELKHVQKQLWRRQGELRKRPRDIEQLAIHACSGTARAFIIGYGLRSGISLVTALIRFIQRRRFKMSIIVHALFGEEAFRFGGMIGSFVFLWKMALHTLRLYNPGRKGKRRTEYWHAPLAGALSGIAILAQKQRNRTGIAQQLFVRGLQGWYNILHKRGYLHIPHGDVLLFGAACGQIMYAWLVSPESLNPGYSNWITEASRISPPIRPWVIARHRRPEEAPPVSEALQILMRRDTSALNALKIESIIDNIKEGDFGLPFPACELVHPWADSCMWTQVLRFKDVFAYIAPVYAALHFIPPILLRRKQFMNSPFSVLLRSLRGTARSSAFLSTFVVIFQSVICLRHQTWWFGQTLPKPFRQLWLSKYL